MTQDAARPTGDGVADGRTRESVVRLLLERGPSTAGALAEQLGLSGAAIRRHLDALVAEESVTTRDAPHGAQRGRGRPARQHLLTAAGRARAGHGEGAGDLAIDALRFLSEVAGEDAVRDFARRRIAALVAPHREELAVGDRRRRVAALARALGTEGYAASSRPATAGAVAGGPPGEQLCQHHCPVAHVAAEFPQLCEAETEVFAEVLGTHVQRLSTIARGDAACTTHVPPAVQDTPEEHTTTAGTPQRRQVV